MSTLPDSTPVIASSILGDEAMTLGEACSRWKDARHFCIEPALRTNGVWRAGMLTIRIAPVPRESGYGYTYRGWDIHYDPPPIPIRSVDWHFVHPDYDASYEGPEDGWVDNGLGGDAESLEACCRAIDERIAELAEAA